MLECCCFGPVSGSNFKQLPLLFDETHLVGACTAAQGHTVKEAVVNPLFSVISLQAGSQYCPNLDEIASVTEKKKQEYDDYSLAILIIDPFGFLVLMSCFNRLIKE